MVNPFAVVEDFERELAEFAGAPYAVATMTGTWAIFLSLAYYAQAMMSPRLTIPARTFISVPLAAMQAGYMVEFDPAPWSGVYQLDPLPIFDGALRFRRGMYAGGLHCLSFHARKSLPIGEGGAILCETINARDWLRAARYSGRTPPDYRPEKVAMMGWQAYMAPDKAARGLHLLSYAGDGEPDQVIEYADLREAPIFKGAQHSYGRGWTLPARSPSPDTCPICNRFPCSQTLACALIDQGEYTGAPRHG